MLANVFGPEGLIVVAIIALVFGASRLPKLARSVGAAKSEFESAIAEGKHGQQAESGVEPATASTPVRPTSDAKGS